MADRALPILEITADSIRINKRNFKSVLDKVGVHPFAFISINGASRTGKSYALNYFIRYFEAKSRKNSNSDSSWFNSELSSNFEWRSGLDRTTVGINLWSKPYFVKDPTSGQKMAVLLMDCQGLFDPQTTPRQNAIIFSLSTLCSSLSIFNLMRHVDENVFQQLQLFTGYANMVSPGAGSGGKGSKNGNLQKLIFLIRDFDAIQQYHHGYHDEESKPRESPRNYFRDIFLMDPQAQQQGDRDQATINPAQDLAIRKEILNSYHQIGAYLLPDPGKEFRRDPKAPTDEDFNEHVKGFVHLLNSDDEGSFFLAPKKYGGVPVTGQEFMKYVDQWAELCKESGENFPDVQTVSESMATIQNSTAMDKAIAYYNEEMDKFLAENTEGVGENIFVSKYEKLETESLKIFVQSPRLHNDVVMDKYGCKLKMKMMEKFETNKQINSTRLFARIHCQKYKGKKREL